MHQKENLAKLKQMNELAPEVMKAFWAFDKAGRCRGRHSSQIQRTHCRGRGTHDAMPLLHRHSQRQRTKAGATDAEMTEAAMVAAALRAGGAVTHATHALLKEVQNAN